MIRDNWFPVLKSEDLKSNKVLSHQILSEPIVFYRDKENKPICVQDRCPHRESKLSLGRVVDGKLECAYHGWQYNSDGVCVKIPTNPDIETKNISCVKKKCIEKYGYIWAWGGNVSEANAELFPNHVFDQQSSDKHISLFSFTTRLKVPYDLLVENFLDVSHLPFVHHRTLSRRTYAQPFDTKIQEETERGFTGQIFYSKENMQKFNTSIEFISPYIVVNDLKIRDGSTIRAVHCCTPMNSSETNYTMFQLVSTRSALTPYVFNSFIGKRFVTKMFSKALNQDIQIFNSQRENRKLGAKLANKLVKSDLLCKKYRDWYNKNHFESDWFSSF